MTVAWYLALAAALTLAAGLKAQPAPLTRFAEEKAEVLLRTKLPCLGCHQFGSEGGQLAPDLVTVRERRSPEYIAAIIDDPQRVRPGSLMPRHPMASSEQRLIVRYLASRPGSATGAVDILPATVADRSAAALYARFCAGCHGTTGGGDGPNARSLPVAPAVHSSRTAMALRPDDALFDAIVGGGAIMNRSPRMPAFGSLFTTAEVTSLVRYIRQLCRCAGPAWSTDGRKQ